MATLSGRAAAIKFSCVASLLALAACNNPPPPPAPQVVERTRVVEQPVPVPEPAVAPPTVNIDVVNAHRDDDDRRKREEEARRHDDHPH